jgi:hypothetical protein
MGRALNRLLADSIKTEGSGRDGTGARRACFGILKDFLKQYQPNDETIAFHIRF